MVLKDEGQGGRSLSMPIAQTAVPTGTWRVKAFTDPKRPAIGESHLHGRGLCPGSPRIRTGVAHRQDRAGCAGRGHAERPLPLRRAGFGQSRSSKATCSSAAAKERPGFPGYQFGTGERVDASNEQPLNDLSSHR
jgi:hypothetical protein